MSTEHVQFTHNGEDTIYHQKTPNSFRFAFLVVSEYFDTPDAEITRCLQYLCDKLNEEQERDDT